MLLEERRYPPPEEFAAQANAQPDIYDERFEEFWEREGRERVTWFEPFTKLYEWEPPYAKWYLGGKLNVCFNCVDRHVEAGQRRQGRLPLGGRAGRTTARESRTPTSSARSSRFANALKKLGVQKGTPVAIYMGMVPELPVAMLACTRLGAPHTVVFGGFSADSLSGRMNDMECEVLITQDEAWRRGTTVPLKGTADEAMAAAPGVKHVRRPAPHRQRRADDRTAATTGGTTLERRPTTRVVPAASRWTARTCSSCMYTSGHDREAEGDRRTRPPATSSASRRRTTTSST